LVKRGHLYWVIAFALAALSAAYASPYGALQSALLTVVLLVIAVQGLGSAEGEWRPEQHPPVVRSRILHYSRISKAKDSGHLQQTADNPFEASLLGHPDWSQFTKEKLDTLSRSIFDQNQPPPANSLIHTK
jgi:hypothetical protein